MIASAGIDTWSPAWYVAEGSPAERFLTAEATVAAKRGRWLPDPIDGHRVGWFPDSRMAVAEGHPDAEGLCLPEQLCSRLSRLRDRIEEAGLELPESERAFDGVGFAGLDGIRRMDCTVDFEVEASTGIAVLGAIAALTPNRNLQPVIRRQTGGPLVETVSWHGRRGIVARAYDKSVESNSGPRGTRPRLEAQYRWASGSRRGVEELTASYVRDKFVTRFAPLWRASKGVKIMGSTALAHELRQRVHCGHMTPGQAVSAAGYAFLAKADVHLGARNTQWRHRRLLEDAGIVLDDVLDQAQEVDLHAVLDEALETDAWERRG
jgi:hypothetical protein